VSYDLRLSGGDVEDFKRLMTTATLVEPNGDDGWIYGNEFTGVYFTINVDEVIDDEEAYEHGYPRGKYVECSINYLRPTFFVDESIPVILGYAGELGWTVTDPQMSCEPLAPEAVDVAAIRVKWIEVTRSMLTEFAGPRMPHAAATSMWQHNRQVNEKLRAAFVPTVKAARHRKDPARAVRAVSWLQGNGGMFPRAEFIVIISDRVVKRGKAQMTFVPYDAFLASVEPYTERRAGYVVLPGERAAEATEATRKLRGEDFARFEILGNDEFVDLD
jgi:hypothetical protein